MGAGHLKQVGTQASEADHGHGWYAVYTAFRSEKQVASHLMRKNIEVYLPLITKSRRYVRKVKTYQVPMIGCYLFVFIQKQQYTEVLETERVLRFVKNGNEPARIKSHEIDLLRRIEGAEMEVESHPGLWTEGDHVELCQGSLSGLQGRLLKRAGKKSFMIEFESLGITLQVNVESGMIRKINKAGAVMC